MSHTYARVSIAIPTYNHAHFLAEAIDSALAQTRPADEIVVIDNDSTDHTAEVVQRYPTVRYIHQANQGICGSSNRAIREATGEYLILLHSDDRLLPCHIETSLEAFHDTPDAAFVFGDYRSFDTGSAPHYQERVREPVPDYYAALLRMNFIGPPAVIMFQRDILLCAGGFQKRFERADDHEVYLRLARTYPLHDHRQVVAEYRRHAAQMSRTSALTYKAAMATMREQRPFVKDHPPYRDAYRLGLWHRQRHFGDQIFWQVVTAAKAGEWAQALRDVLILLRFHPKGFFRPIGQKLFHVFTFGAHNGGTL